MHRIPWPSRLLAALAIGVAIIAARADDAAAPAPPPGAIQVPDGTGTWSAGPPSLPAGSMLMRLEGDPSQEGIFTMRVRLPAGSRLEPHWHPRDERITVLSGEVAVGFGDTFAERGMTRFPAGSFYLTPAKSHHYVLAREESVLQLTTLGPWGLHYLAAPAAAASR